MGDMLGRAAGWLRDRLAASASVAVTCRQDGAGCVVNATLGRTLLKLDDGRGGFRMTWTDRDFIFPAAEFTIGSPLPRRGLTIELPADTGLLVYQMLATGGEPGWRWADPYRTLLRVHAKEVGAA